MTFVAMALAWWVQERCIVHDMASTLDYRKLVRNQRGLQFLGEGSDSKLRERFSEIAKNNIATNVHIPVAMGRNLLVPLDGKYLAFVGCSFVQKLQAVLIPL